MAKKIVSLGEEFESLLSKSKPKKEGYKIETKRKDKSLKKLIACIDTKIWNELLAKYKKINGFALAEKTVIKNRKLIPIATMSEIIMDSIKSFDLKEASGHKEVLFEERSKNERHTILLDEQSVAILEKIKKQLKLRSSEVLNKILKYMFK